MTRVLIVDDSEDMQETCELLLEGEGYDVIKASDGAAGLRAVAERRPDVVLLDMMMPDVDGLQFLRRLPIECSQPLPAVIATSGFEPFREEALRAGAVAFLRKPVEVDVLLGALRAAAGTQPVPPSVARHNREDAIAARVRADRMRNDLIAELPPARIDAVRPRLRALAAWLRRYYGWGVTYLQLLRGDVMRIEAACGTRFEGAESARHLQWCDDVIDAGSTLLLNDPLHHVLPHFSQHPQIAAGFRFYAGVPLTTWSGAVLGTLCFCDVESHVLHSEDMHLLESLGRHVAHALEEAAAGIASDDFIVDDAGLFAAEMLPLFVQVGLERAARTGGTVGVSVVRLADAADLELVTRAAYAGGSGAGLVALRRAGDELALIQAGRDVEARGNLASALVACRRAATVRSIGTAWCRLAPGAHAIAERAGTDLCARLVALAADSHDLSPSESPFAPATV